MKIEDIAAIQSMNPQAHDYLEVIGKGGNQHLAVTHKGFFGRLWMKWGFGSASMEKISLYIVNHPEEFSNCGSLEIQKFESLKEKVARYSSNHPSNKISAIALKVLNEKFSLNMKRLENERKEKKKRDIKNAIEQFENSTSQMNPQAKDKSSSRFFSHSNNVLSIDLLNKSTEFSQGSNQAAEHLQEEEAVLFEAIDPSGKIRALLSTGQITHFRGNASLDEAQLILLNDTEHRDKEQQLIRGQITNALQTKSNILLCEANDCNKTSFSSPEIDHYFAPNLEESVKSSSQMAGWDNNEIYEDGIEKMKSICRIDTIIRDAKNNHSGVSEEDLVAQIGMDKIMNKIKLQEEIEKGAHARTKTEWKTIKKFVLKSPQSRIFVFAGAAHINRDEWLLEQLRNSGIKYCILTPKIFLDKSQEEPLSHCKYYGV